MTKQKPYFLIKIIGAILLLCCALIVYLIFTTAGSSFITRLALSHYLESIEVDIEKTKGTLSRGLLLQDIEIEALQGLPQGSVIRIQSLEARFTALGLKGINIKIDNARLRLPESEPILFYGSYSDSALNINAYSKQVDIRSILDLFTENRALKDVSGRMSDLDVYVRGSFFEPVLSGEFGIDELSYNRFSMINCPGNFKVTLKDIKDALKVLGEVTLRAGTISGPKTAIIELKTSKLLFSGNPKSPTLDINGTSIVDNITIKIALKGTMDKPDLRLQSEPAMPQERLLLMLATGKSWGSTDEAISRGKISAELAKDFLDYFIFAGSGNKMAKRFGIDEISFKYDSKTKGVGIKKTITDKFEAGIGIETTEKKTQQSSTLQKIEGSYKITDTVSVGAEKELIQDKTNIQDKSQTKDKVILKYKKEF